MRGRFRGRPRARKTTGPTGPFATRSGIQPKTPETRSHGIGEIGGVGWDSAFVPFVEKRGLPLGGQGLQHPSAQTPVADSEVAMALIVVDSYLIDPVDAFFGCFLFAEYLVCEQGKLGSFASDRSFGRRKSPGSDAPRLDAVREAAADSHPVMEE